MWTLYVHTIDYFHVKWACEACICNTWNTLILSVSLQRRQMRQTACTTFGVWPRKDLPSTFNVLDKTFVTGGHVFTAQLDEKSVKMYHFYKKNQFFLVEIGVYVVHKNTQLCVNYVLTLYVTCLNFLCAHNRSFWCKISLWGLYLLYLKYPHFGGLPETETNAIIGMYQILCLNLEKSCEAFLMCFPMSFLREGICACFSTNFHAKSLKMSTYCSKSWKKRNGMRQTWSASARALETMFWVVFYSFFYGRVVLCARQAVLQWFAMYHITDGKKDSSVKRSGPNSV